MKAKADDILFVSFRFFRNELESHKPAEERRPLAFSRDDNRLIALYLLPNP